MPFASQAVPPYANGTNPLRERLVLRQAYVRQAKSMIDHPGKMVRTRP